MKKILIIGSPGAGKSTFANKLAKILNREITHLDKLYYKTGWVRVPKDEWVAIVKNLVLRTVSTPIRVGLYGSRAKGGSPGKWSDIDVVVAGDEPLWG